MMMVIWKCDFLNFKQHILDQPKPWPTEPRIHWDLTGSNIFPGLESDQRAAASLLQVLTALNFFGWSLIWPPTSGSCRKPLPLCSPESTLIFMFHSGLTELYRAFASLQLFGFHRFLHRSHICLLCIISCYMCCAQATAYIHFYISLSGVQKV